MRILKCTKTFAYPTYALPFTTLTVVQKPLLPVTVQDQIRLWELERNRLKSQEGDMIHKARGCMLTSIAVSRLPLQRLRVTSRLRVRFELRQAA